MVTFFRANGLSIHPQKTKFMLFSNSKAALNTNLQIFINNNNVNENDPSLLSPLYKASMDETIKFLGVHIDQNLNFKHHTSKIARKISNALYFMRNVKNTLDSTALLSMYYSLVHSHLIYGILSWSSGPAYNINKLFKLQKKAIRIVHNAPYNAHTESLFKLSKVLPLPSLINYFRIQFMQQFIHGHLPISFVNTWAANVDRNMLAGFGRANYNLRNSSDLFIPFCRLMSLDQHPLFLLPRVWTNFECPELKFIREKNEFNHKFKKYLLDKLIIDYKCNRLFCPQCSWVPPTSSDSD